MNTICRYCPDCQELHTHEIRLLADGEMPYVQHDAIKQQYPGITVVFACYNCNDPWVPTRRDYEKLNPDQAKVITDLTGAERLRLAHEWEAAYGC